LATNPAVAVERLSKYFPHIELSRLLKGSAFHGSWALREVDLELWPGEALCIMGPNGSGKTTLLKLIATLLLPTEGRIFVQGLDAMRRPLAAKRHLGFITANEESFYGRLTGRQNLAFFARLHNLEPKAAIDPVAQLLQLEPYLDRHFFACSTGIRRRFDIARGLLHHPDILLLDEPTTNLDPISAMEVRDFLVRLRDQGTTIILVTHRLEEVTKLGGRMAVMLEGRFQEVRPGPGEDLEDLYRRIVVDGRRGAA
jgi:ABC-type multidrug transport system ATPase subunit